MTSEFVIRAAQLTDAAAVYDIRRAALRAQSRGFYPESDLEVWTAGELDDGFARHVAEAGHVVVYQDDIVGFGILDLNSGRVDAVFTRPDWIGKGVGKRILHFLEQLARESGIHELHLNATLNAASFYRTQGFVGDVIGAYHSPRGITLDCVPMRKRI